MPPRTCRLQKGLQARDIVTLLQPEARRHEGSYVHEPKW